MHRPRLLTWILFFLSTCLIYLLFNQPHGSSSVDSERPSGSGPENLVHLKNQEKWTKIPKRAYAFYAPNEQYLCYALINIDRLFNVVNIQSTIDVILIVNSKSGVSKPCVEQCFPSTPLKLYYTPEPDSGYDISFGFMETFGMTEYDRIILMDADGIIMRNLDHLFDLDLEYNNIASTIAKYNYTEILTTMIVLIRPSRELYEMVSKFQHPVQVEKAIRKLEDDPSMIFASNGDFLLNTVYNDGLVLVKKLPRDYTAWDTEFSFNWNKNAASKSYFVAFEERPLKWMENAKHAASSGNAPNSYAVNIFWKAFYQRCNGLLEHKK